MLSKLATLALAYIQFMSTVGSTSDTQMYIKQVPTLFAENITKVENGKLIVTGHKELLNQLENARNYGLHWKMEVLDLVADHENNTVAIRFTWDSEKVGKHITMAILKFDMHDKITEVKEVYNKFADITH